MTPYYTMSFSEWLSLYLTEYNILGINSGCIFLFILIILGIILIKNRNILKPNKGNFIAFLVLFTFLSLIPILDLSTHVTRPEIASLFQFFIDFLNDECPPLFFGCRCGKFDSHGESLLIIFSLLAIISYTFSCLMISAYDKFKIKRIKE